MWLTSGILIYYWSVPQFTALQDEGRGVVPARRKVCSLVPLLLWAKKMHSERQGGVWESQVLFPALPVPSGVLLREPFNKVHWVKNHKLIQINVAYSLETVVMKIFSVTYLKKEITF